MHCALFRTLATLVASTRKSTALAITLAAVIAATVPAACGDVIAPGGGSFISTRVVGGSEIRFIEITRTDFTAAVSGTGDQLAIGELEAFARGDSFSDPNIGSGAVVNTNDFALGTPEGGSASVNLIDGASSHGADANLINGIRSTGGNTWQRLDAGSGVRVRIDLGDTEQVGAIRLWQRADGCCQGRLADFTVDAFADDGLGNPGANKFSTFHGGIVTPTSGSALFLLPDETFTLKSGDEVQIELRGSDQMTDLLQVGLGGTTDLQIDPGVTLQLSTLDDFTNFNVGDTFQIIEAGTISGSFDTVIQSGGVEFDLANLGTTGEITVSAVAPEPSSLMLIGMGSVALAGYRRRRRVLA